MLEIVKPKYMIYGSLDNGTPNLDIFFISDDKAKAEEVYKKLQRLNDLQNPETKELKEEHNKLLEELQDEEVEIFGEDDYIENEPVYWELNDMVEFQEV